MTGKEKLLSVLIKIRFHFVSLPSTWTQYYTSWITHLFTVRSSYIVMWLGSSVGRLQYGGANRQKLLNFRKFHKTVQFEVQFLFNIYFYTHRYLFIYHITLNHWTIRPLVLHKLVSSRSTSLNQMLLLRRFCIFITRNKNRLIRTCRGVHNCSRIFIFHQIGSEELRARALD